MKTFASATAAHNTLLRAGYERVATVQGTDSVRHGFQRRVNGALESAVLTVYSASCATVRYL